MEENKPQLDANSTKDGSGFHEQDLDGNIPALDDSTQATESYRETMMPPPTTEGWTKSPIPYRKTVTPKWWTAAQNAQVKATSLETLPEDEERYLEATSPENQTEDDESSPQASSPASDAWLGEDVDARVLRRSVVEELNGALQLAGSLNDLLTDSEEEYLRSLTTGKELGRTDSPAEEPAAADSRSDPERGIVTKFLQLVESQQRLGENCTAGTEFQLEGVVDRYGQERFRYQAELTVKMANLLTRLWKYSPDVMNSENLLHALVLSLIEADGDIFAAGNCYDQAQYKDYHLYCPFAYRLPEGTILSKDLAAEYDYMSNTSEWFYIARSNAERSIQNDASPGWTGSRTYAVAAGANSPPTKEVIKPVTFTDGFWSKPYFDCGGGNIWMMTYTVPFFGFENGSYFFKGTSGIDIDLRRVDIDQCPQRRNSTDVNIFAGSDKCKERTTKVGAIGMIPLKMLSPPTGAACRDGTCHSHLSQPARHTAAGPAQTC
ncbi:uncharacterized protein LOC119089366 [Pollicipes pollicipes]|uniref:uncharacterized protein LOC119089366 n=1 Tax=Pollicipes pollicipes TaxID=41117 RepID=UPI001885309E|nr:uncharacterized protein LOC119089366 [Pollicipes pollicipes]